MSALTINEAHWLIPGETVRHQPTPNVGTAFTAGRPDTLVIHFTGGRSAQSSAEWLCNPKAKASAHVVIDKTGALIQLADFRTITWHAGRSTWEGRSGLNAYSIGIELDNAGQLEARADGYYTWFGTRIPEEEVIQATHRNENTPAYWHTYTAAQIEMVEQLCELLIETYGITTILGHEEISPGRKVDPGPAFPLDRIRNRLVFGDRSEDMAVEILTATGTQGMVTADRLNMRSLPNIGSPIVTEPLKRGTLVSIDEERSGWYKVKIETEGWVSSEYIKTNS